MYYTNNVNRYFTCHRQKLEILIMANLEQYVLMKKV